MGEAARAGCLQHPAVSRARRVGDTFTVVRVWVKTRLYRSESESVVLNEHQPRITSWLSLLITARLPSNYGNFFRFVVVVHFASLREALAGRCHHSGPFSCSAMDLYGLRELLSANNSRRGNKC